MATLDRAEIIELLGRLGADDNEAALAAARELARKISAAGLTWDDVVRANFDAGADEEASEAPASAPDDAGPQELTPADKAEAARLIDGLLARKTLSDTTRGDLTEMKRSIAEGTFDAIDHRYVRALSKRLGAG